MYASSSLASSLLLLPFAVMWLLLIICFAVVLWLGTFLGLLWVGWKLGDVIGRLILPSDAVLRDAVARLRLRQRIRAQVGLRRRRRLRRPVGRAV